MSFHFLKHFARSLFTPDILLRQRYKGFKALLEKDHLCHGLMEKIERFYDESEIAVDFCAVRAVYDELNLTFSGMLADLRMIAPHSLNELHHRLKCIDKEIREVLAPNPAGDSPPFILPLHEITLDSLGIVGGKAANLALLSQKLNLPVPRGFALTSTALHHFYNFSGLREEIDQTLAQVETGSANSLHSASRHLVSMIMDAPLPADLMEAIANSYALEIVRGDCAVRSSAVGEDGNLTFAGQYRSLLRVAPSRLAEAYQEVIASKYAPEALAYRIRNGLLDEESPMAVLMTEMIDAELSGVVYSRDPLSNCQDTITIYSIPGTGDLLMDGAVVPGRTQVSTTGGFHVCDPAPVVEANGKISLGVEETVAMELPSGASIPLTEADALQLAAWAREIESFRGTPQDIEWCRSMSGSLTLLQSRPLRVQTVEPDNRGQEIHSAISSRVLLSGGEKAASGIGAGVVAKVFSSSDLKRIPEGSVLVAPTASPMFAQVISRVRAVVTDLGSAAGHFASVAREAGIPTLVGTQVATKLLKQGEPVTVDADRKTVFAGIAESLLNSSGDRNLRCESPFRDRLRDTLKLISPLHLTDPLSPDFDAVHCKTLNDVLRFSHEKAVGEMFGLGTRGWRPSGRARKLQCDIPVTLYALDLGGGIRREADRKKITIEDILSSPFKSLWQGMTELKEAWSSDVPHFDWWSFDQISMGGGIIRADSQTLSSFALLARDYFNVNLRFGLHFTVVDSFFGTNPHDNRITMRFGGGGGEFEGRYLRGLFIAQVLENHGFEVQAEKDRVHAQVQHISLNKANEKLRALGRLLAFTPLLDMTLNDVGEVGRLVAVFSRPMEGESDENSISSESGLSDDESSFSAPLLYRLTWVSDQLAVGYAPMSYDELESIKRQGIGAIVNLCSEYPDLHQIEESYGFDVFYLAVPDGGVPELSRMEEALAWLDEAVYLGKRVLVHCRLGIGRTGTFITSYLLRRGFGLELAETALKKIRSAPTSMSQRQLIRKYGKHAGRLTIREPSLESAHPVDLSLYFAEYNSLCGDVEEAFDPVSGGVPVKRCGQDFDSCCRHFFYLQFIEAVHISYKLNKELRLHERQGVLQRARAVGRSAENVQGRDISYVCPLSVDSKCILYSHRPIACRTHGLSMLRNEIADEDRDGLMQSLPLIEISEELHEISRRLFYALTGSFLEGQSLIFPITHVLTGKFVEDYFAVLTHMRKQR